MTEHKKRPEPVKCSERVWHRHAWGDGPCSRNGVVERNGRWYCKQHDPEVKKARDAERKARWDAEQELERAKRQRRKDAEAALDNAPKLAARIEQLEAALRFYADKANHRDGRHTGGMSDVYVDAGDIARKALE